MPAEGGARVVTRLALKGGQADRVAIYLDGHLAFEVAAVIAREVGLSRGDVLREDYEALLVGRDAPYRARDLALGMLSRREMTRKEVATKLHRAGLGEEAVESALVWLEERGYVDDRRFAAAYATERLKAGWGRRRIAGELRMKGVAGEIIRGEPWEEMLQDQGVADESEAVTALARRRFGALLASDPETGRRRLAGFLARRGHDWEAVARITREVCGDVEGLHDLSDADEVAGEREGLDD